MELLKENKAILIIVLIIIALLGYYGTSGGFNDGAIVSTGNAAAAQDSVKDKELIRLLADMRNVRLEGHIFEDQAYLALRDFGRTIIPEPVSRPDPFAPVDDHEVTITGGGTRLSDDVLLR